MDFNKMTVEQLKEFLDENNVNYKDAKAKADYVKLAENVKAKLAEDTEETLEKPSQEQPASLADKVKSAIKIERTETKKVDNVSYLKDRDYSQLTVGERAMIREQSPEYQNEDDGIEVTVTDRLPTKWRIVKLVDKSYSKLIKGATYKLSQADFDALKNEKVKVKTEATKNKCCGQAKYESIALLEVTND